MKRSFSPAVIALLLIASAVPAVANDPEAASIEVIPGTIEIEVGETLTVEAIVRDADGNPIEAPVMYYTRSRRQLAVNTATGEIEALKPGEFTLVVMVPLPGGGTARQMSREDDALKVEVTVVVPKPALASVELWAPAPLYTHTRVRTAATVLDISAATRDDARLEFTSSNPEVAEVNSLGTLELKSPGTATIGVTGDDGIADELTIEVAPNTTASIALEASAMEARTGDVIRFTATPQDANGEPIAGLPVQYAYQAHTVNHALGEPGSGLITEDGRFVADTAGEYTIVAVSGQHTASLTVAIEPRDVRRELEFLGQGRVSDRRTSDLWVWEGPDGRDYAATGTHSADGHAYFWDVTEPSNIQLIDTIKVDARTVNDIKVSEDGRIAVISREGASNRRNGLLILDVSDLYNQGARVLSRYDDRLTGGVHNVFIYEDHIYALSAGQRYDVINIEDPANPHRVGAFELETQGRSIHDVWVVDGIAYSSNWADGIVAVDVGGGGQGGSPRNPIELGRTSYPSGWNHAAIPFKGDNTGKFYMIGGDEARLDADTADYEGEPGLMAGWVRFFEWDEWDSPAEVARYEVPEAGAHNLWVDEENEILYVAFYQGGLRVVDISGELLGDLYRQGREIAYFLSFDPEGHVPNSPNVWGPQPYKGNIFFSDFYSGLWVVRFKDDAAEKTIED